MRRDDRGSILVTIVEAGVMLGAAYLAEPGNRHAARTRAWFWLASVAGHCAYWLGRLAMRAEIAYWGCVA